jgi:uncharacterized membrane protein HdeD (DUF308 family)
MSLSSSLLWRGLGAIVVGLISVAWPSVTIGAFVILFAVYAFIAAVGDVMRAFSSDRPGPVFGYLVLAALSVVSGLVALFWPGITALALTILVGSWALVIGAIEVAIAFRPGETAGQRTMWVFRGLVSVALAVVLFIRPDIGAASLATVFGLFSIFYGAFALTLYFDIRQARSGVRDLLSPSS